MCCFLPASYIALYDAPRVAGARGRAARPIYIKRYKTASRMEMQPHDGTTIVPLMWCTCAASMYQRVRVFCLRTFRPANAYCNIMRSIPRQHPYYLLINPETHVQIIRKSPRRQNTTPPPCCPCHTTAPILIPVAPKTYLAYCLRNKVQATYASGA